MESLFVGQKKVASNRLRFLQQVTWVQADISRRGNWHKRPMGTVSPVSTPFLPGCEKRGSEVKKLLQFCSKSGSNQPMVRRSSLHEGFVHVKTPMVLGRFEAFFFSSDKFTKIDLALKGDIRNCSKLGIEQFQVWVWSNST